MNLFKWIDNLFTWEPHHIFGDSHYYVNDEYGVRSLTDLTKLGKFMEKLPLLTEILLRLCYYIVAWPLYLCVKIPWVIFRGLFIPRGYLND